MYLQKKEKMLQSLPCLEEELSRVLRNRKKTVLPVDGMIEAAVLIPLYAKNGRIHVLLTKRSEMVEHHRGEISFPGGKLDPEDPDLLTCALREADEEVGIAAEDVRIIGELDDFYTVATNFLVVPFVGIIPYPYEFSPCSREIADLIGVPLDVFFDSDRRSEELWIIKGQTVEIVSYKWKGHNIWGATARIMKHFVEMLENGASCAYMGGSQEGTCR
ncbi:MAG: CoA pyrophosphatase [Desulfomonilaceae bacterium]|nr:CoA pyrophosphatase [Desulfomonilaceae bacterium]